MPEKQFSEIILNRLSEHFFIKTEVCGRHFSGKKMRVDAVIRPMDTCRWMRKDIAFGIEFKRPDCEHSPRMVSALIRQAYDYIYTDFDDYGHIPILVCPLKVQKFAGGGDEMPFIKRVIGQFGIGEIVDHKYYGLTIYFQEHHRIWSERSGVHDGSHWGLNFK